MQHEQIVGGKCAVIALYGDTKILLIRNPGRPDWKWKLLSETNKPGESMMQTLVSGLDEEAGFKGIKTELGADNKIARITDERIEKVGQLGEPEYIRSRKPHDRYFYGVKVSDKLIHELAGQRITIEEDDGQGGTEVEDIETAAFPLAMLDGIENLLRPHAEMIRSIPNRVVHEIT